MTVAPSLKVTFPVGVPAVPVTVAVYVTGVPMVAGLLDDVTADVVELLFTVKTMLSALQGRKFPSPL